MTLLGGGLLADPRPSSYAPDAANVLRVPYAVAPGAAAVGSAAFINGSDRKLQLYMDALSKGFDTKVQTVLPKIGGAPRQLLALKYYLRRRQDLNRNWTWTPKEIARYKKSSNYHQSMAEVEKVKAKFAELNPGYSLGVNTEVRTLDDQIANWNTTRSIQASATELAAAALKVLADSNAFQPDLDRNSMLRFQRFLESYKVAYVPTVAVPGLSQHGQLRAFDFVVKQGAVIVAGTQTASITSIWDRSGWTARLNEAIRQASGKFSGPLASPREPWHYAYTR